LLLGERATKQPRKERWLLLQKRIFLTGPPISPTKTKHNFGRGSHAALSLSTSGRSFGMAVKIVGTNNHRLQATEVSGALAQDLCMWMRKTIRIPLIILAFGEFVSRV